MDIRICILLLLFLSSCSSEEQVEWNINELYKVKDVSEVVKADTIEIKYTDKSFVLFDEYCKWKTDFFIWLNKSKLTDDRIYKITNATSDEVFKSYVYNSSDIQEVISLYDKNEMFRNISFDMFNELTISEIACLIHANYSLNEYEQNYTGNLSDLMYDYTVCEDSCFAINRLNFMGEMINEVKFPHFWYNEIKVEPCHLISWMNSLPNGSIDIEERIYCNKDLFSKSKKVLSYLKEGDVEQLRLDFYSNNFFNEISFSSNLLNIYKDNLSEVVIEEDEMIRMENLKLSVDSKYIEADSLDITNVILPMSAESNSGKITEYLIQTYTLKEGVYKLLGLRLQPVEQPKKMNKKEI